MIAAVVQIRMGSTRLPKKAFLDLCGQPLIYHVISRLKYCNSIDKIIVATTNSPSDDDIQAWCDANDIICFRGDEENVLKRFYDCAIANCLDIIVRITGDDPFKDFRLIDRAVDCIIASNLDFVCNNSPVTYPEGLDVEVITFNALKKIYQNALTSDHREHVTLYVHENISAFNTLNLSNGKDMSYHRWTIDYAEDYHFARVVYEELYTDGELFLTEDIYNLLSGNQTLQLINKNVNRSTLYEK
jgi:spore coat polysaccharide biosynthesis protein SpsF